MIVSIYDPFLIGHRSGLGIPISNSNYWINSTSLFYEEFVEEGEVWEIEHDRRKSNHWAHKFSYGKHFTGSYSDGLSRSTRGRIR